MNGIELLDQFRQKRSESAFRELVSRYTNLVYSVARRRLARQDLAQEAAQTVFIRLAQSPPHLSSDPELTAWLHRTTVHVSIDLWRSEVRRRTREEQVAAMEFTHNQPSACNEIAPALDEALNELNEADRQVILLRFFDGKSMRALGEMLGISEDAAKMRVSRAVDRLRDQLGLRGATCTAMALGGFLSDRAVEAAPGEVAAALAAFHYPMLHGLAGSAAAAGTFATGLSVAKLAGGSALLLLIGAATWILVHRTGQRPDDSLAPANPGGRLEARSRLNPPSAGAQTMAARASTNAPDAVKLLQGVARARQRIASGSMEFEVDTFHPQETNHWRVGAVFEGNKRRLEQFGREYSYTYDPPRAQEIEAKVRAFGPDREGAVAAGLLKGFESHYVTTYDGTSLMRYWENDGKPAGTIVDDPSKGSSSFVFDPRCLGLAASPGLGTIEECLGGDSASRAELVGQENLDGTPCWRLRVPSAQPVSVWVDAAHPTRVLKVQSVSAVVISKYDAAKPGEPLPSEVLSTHFRDSQPLFGTRLATTKSQYNVSVDPATFTLAGLGMKVGTEISDIRIHRSIGYWTGSSLSDNPPSTRKSPPQEQVELQELLEILENNPDSLAALDAATWILLNTPDGPPVEKAAAVILQSHIQSPELGFLCQQMERVRHRCASELLEAVLKDNPHPEVRAVACFTLATLKKDACNFGKDQKLKAEAEKLFERVITEFAKAGATGAELARKAEPELSELRRLSIGKRAPELEGTDLKGGHIKLSEHRGKVVLLVFWTASTVDGPEEYRQALAPLAGRPLAWITVNCDDELSRATAALEKHPIPAPVIWDGRSGPISAEWNIHSWPSIFVLDREGVIRARNVRGPDLREAVKALLSR